MTINSSGGYTCPDCGTWVMYGMGHVCQPVSSTPTPMPLTPILDERFYAALERIAEALETLAGQERGPLPADDNDDPYDDAYVEEMEAIKKERPVSVGPYVKCPLCHENADWQDGYYCKNKNCSNYIR